MMRSRFPIAKGTLNNFIMKGEEDEKFTVLKKFRGGFMLGSPRGEIFIGGSSVDNKRKAKAGKKKHVNGAKRIAKVLKGNKSGATKRSRKELGPKNPFSKENIKKEMEKAEVKE